MHTNYSGLSKKNNYDKKQVILPHKSLPLFLFYSYPIPYQNNLKNQLVTTAGTAAEAL